MPEYSKWANETQWGLNTYLRKKYNFQLDDLCITNLLCHQLRIYPRFSRRSSFTDVTHEALECFSCISISTDTAVPIVVFQNLRLTFSATRMVHCSSKSVIRHWSFSKESLPPSASSGPHQEFLSLLMLFYFVAVLFFKNNYTARVRANVELYSLMYWN